MAFDLMVPPLALLVTAVAGLSLLAAGAAVAGASTGPLLLGLVSGLVVLLAVLSAWWRFARHLLPARLLASVPAYVLWKMPLYLGFFLRGRHKRWERTTRATGAAGKPIP